MRPACREISNVPEILLSENTMHARNLWAKLISDRIAIKLSTGYVFKIVLIACSM